MREEIGVPGQAEPISHWVTVFLTDVGDRPRINPVRVEFFGAARPASTLVEVSRLAVEGARIEVEAVAVVRS